MNTAAIAVACFAVAIACQLKMHRLLTRGRIKDLTVTQQLFFHVLVPLLAMAAGAYAAIQGGA